ncbi:16S rRNA (cytosine(967)-C(5))-methyltransferase RsmB [Tepidibacillus decaturensis]|uniref:16S rRNA (cytosine(967)-C(5))-methyltransferase n=1 Tax=Tepidibacillus decaturensis TaxID=1413211 RepID=A0A135L7T4_9BACI|nr:16S rRNA (cytosine(967)-C(5))-methyltransferase RsmB [Tepidibacillus decaturensis]KXG45030.1 16S rRNA methyltransferase [Tepidibacillus decaturensis]
MNKKWTAREVSLEVLTKVDKEKAYSNLQLNQALKEANLSRVDANFATELIYGTIQHLNTIDWILQPFLKTNKLESWVRSLLRLSVYQLWYLDRVPVHAIVNEAVNLAKKKGHKGIASLVNGVLRNIIRNKDQIRFPTDLNDVKRIALEHSHPDWLVERLIRDYGIEEAEEVCRSNNIAPHTSIRVNPLKITRDEMMEKIKEELGEDTEVLPSPLSEQGIRVKGRGNLALTHWYKDGYFTIQDESSMLVAHVVDPKPGMFVLDAAAAPGGKTTHLAELMQNQGKIIAADLHKHKIKLIEEQQERLDLHIIETLHSDARKIKEQFGQVFDRILLDVPCSGLGVIRRKPDLKWVKAETDIEELTKIQKDILKNVSLLLKPGGILVYSTCTMTTEENQKIVGEFIKQHSDFRLDQQIANVLPKAINEKLDTRQGMIQILPHYFDSDGFFISRILRIK